MKIQKIVWPAILGCLCGLCAIGAIIAVTLLSGIITVEFCVNGGSIIILSFFSVMGLVIGSVVGFVRYNKSIRSASISELKLDSLPQEAYDYIMSVGRYMSYKFKVRLEVMDELAGHFDNELKDCSTDEERQQKAQKLIEQFGDAKLLGILLRRAKKRCRPLWRTLLVRTFQVVSVFLIIYLVWFSSGRPVITIDYVEELNKLNRTSADESLNAAPLYDKAAEKYSKLPDNIANLLGKKYDDVNDTDKQAIEKFLNDYKDAFDLVVAGTKKPYLWRNLKSTCVSDTIEVLMPYLSEYRRLAYSLRLRAQFRARQNHLEDAFDDIKSCYCFGRHIREGDKLLIEQLVGIAIEALSVQTLRRILGEYQIDSSKLTQLQKDFEQMIAGENFDVSFKAEKLFQYDWIQKCFTEGGPGGGHPYPQGVRKIAQASRDVNAPYHPGFQKMTQAVRSVNKKESRFVDYLENSGTAIAFLLGLSPGRDETLKSVNGLYDFLDSEFALKTPAQVQTQKTEIDKKVKRLTGRNYLIRILVPSFERVNQISHRLKTEVEATLTMLALLRYKQDKDQYPQILDELKATGYIKEIPIDAFSDKPLVYRKTDSDFILYSVGLNFKDDGGQTARDYKGRVNLWAEEGDAVFWPVQK